MFRQNKADKSHAASFMLRFLGEFVERFFFTKIIRLFYTEDTATQGERQFPLFPKDVVFWKSKIVLRHSPVIIHVLKGFLYGKKL